jgi:hypothetical protein
VPDSTFRIPPSSFLVHRQIFQVLPFRISIRLFRIVFEALAAVSKCGPAGKRVFTCNPAALAHRDGGESFPGPETELPSGTPPGPGGGGGGAAGGGGGGGRGGGRGGEWSGVEWSGVEWSGVEWSEICDR